MEPLPTFIPYDFILLPLVVQERRCDRAGGLCESGQGVGHPEEGQGGFWLPPERCLHQPGTGKQHIVKLTLLRQHGIIIELWICRAVEVLITKALWSIRLSCALCHGGAGAFPSSYRVKAWYILDKSSLSEGWQRTCPHAHGYFLRTWLLLCGLACCSRTAFGKLL